MHNPEIHRRKTVVMFRIQQVVAWGYRWYTSGTVPASKAQKLAAKFAELYRVDATESQRRYAKKQGKANAFLFLYPRKGTDEFLWWLLATDGEGEVHQRERLRLATEAGSRLRWNDDYELIVMTREGQPKASVTWRMTRENYHSWHARIRQAVRTRRTNQLVRQAIWSLYRAPGFGQVRLQVKALSFMLQKEWKRTRKQT
ncbi:MAG TPA: hypothetical protein V6C97_27260, partial [Oculatellaceae cyanobacterium]